MDEVLYYKAWVEELQAKNSELQKELSKTQDRMFEVQESVADNLSYYFEKIASVVSDAQGEIRSICRENLLYSCRLR